MLDGTGAAVALIAGGGTLQGDFVVAQLRTSDPLLKLRMVHYRYFSADATGVFCALRQID